MFNFYTLIKRNKKESLAVSKKGFVSIYGVIILNLCLSFVFMLTQRIKAQVIQNENLSYAELYSIKKVKENIANEDKKDGNLGFLDYQITLKYDHNNCHIVIMEDGKIVLESALLYDELNNCIVSYEYID